VKIAIIGAGLAGVMLARRLREAGHHPSIFEKSRGAGGRMATRRTEAFAFDHGAAYFTAHSEAFRTFLEPFIANGHVALWPGRFVRFSADTAAASEAEERFVSVPAMNALCKAIVDPASLHTQAQVAPIREPGLVHDSADNLLGQFDWIVSTAPGPQTAALFADIAPVPLAPEHMSGGYTAMFGFAGAHDPGWDVAEVEDPVIGSIIVNSAKPGREGPGTAFVTHARTDWADAMIDEETTAIRPRLAEGFTRLTGIDAGKADYATAHRWRYAHANAGFEDGFLLAPDAGLAACGDWCMGGGVEAAFTSATRLADWLLG